MICDVPVVRINVLLNHQCINVYDYTLYTYTDKYSAQEKANDKGYLVSINIGHCVWIHQISCFICVVGRMKLMPRMSSLKL